jgi:uncharacterized membrane protein (DUF106 family)
MTTPLLLLSYVIILIFSWLAVSVGFFSNFFFMRSKEQQTACWDDHSPSSAELCDHPHLHLAGCQCWILLQLLLHEVQSDNRQLAGMTTPLLLLSYVIILIFSWLAVSVGFFFSFFFMRSKVATDSLLG